MASVVSNDAAKLFLSLDTPFLRYDKNKVEPITWTAKDFYIQFKHEVRVPSPAGSTVKFSFSTVNGDISFGLNFVTPSNLTEVIREPMREPSDIEPIKGSYKADYEGVFVFIFDNSYSWFTDKILTYNIHLVQPAFILADANRAMQSRRMLASMTEDSKVARDRLRFCKERSQKLTNELSIAEEQLEALQRELKHKKGLLEAADKEILEMSQKIKYNEDKKNGLCIRVLDKKMLSVVLSFIGKGSGAYSTCKYWKALLDDIYPSR